VCVCVCVCVCSVLFAFECTRICVFYRIVGASVTSALSPLNANWPPAERACSYAGALIESLKAPAGYKRVNQTLD
jgi:hypothetical protein